VVGCKRRYVDVYVIVFLNLPSYDISMTDCQSLTKIWRSVVQVEAIRAHRVSRGLALLFF
jgi:hypothetical protein